jgi:regulator of Ty1 transposition protein 109
MHSLSSLLSNALPLPLDASLKVYHVSTPPTPCPALFAAKPGAQEDKTCCESHFLAISVPSPHAPELLALAVEVLVYTASTGSTIFISKADTTGYLYADKIPKDRDISKTILKIFVQHLVDTRRKSSRKVVLSLFARAQNQYLFPGSIENNCKRVLSDRELLRWWCKVLDPVLRSSANATAHVLVAGAQAADTKRYVYPPSVEDDSPDKPRWLWSYPTSLLAPDPSGPTQCLLPRFPDDPKTRFQEDLDEQVTKHGKWTSPSTLDEFWAMMSYRRECYEGRSVGFLWMIFPAGDIPALSNGVTEKEKESTATQNKNQAASVPTPAPALSQSQPETISGASVPEVPEKKSATLETVSPPKISETKPTSLETISPPSPLPSLSSAPVPANPNDRIVAAFNTPVPWPLETRGKRTMDYKQYQQLMDHLMQLDFSDYNASYESTKSWISKAAELNGSMDEPWGVEVKGIGQVGKEVFSKKRKADSVEAGAAVMQLSAGLIRKKPKVRA